MIGSAGLSGNFAPVSARPCRRSLRVDHRILIRDLRHRQPLHADAEPRLVHHHEHRGKAAILLPDQIAGGVVVIHHAGGIAVDAHLVLDRAAGNAVARAQRAVVVDHDLRHDEQRNALGACGRAFDARQHQMDDVFGEVLLAAGDEDLGAGDLVAAVRLFHRLGAQQAQIGAALRLGEIHGAGPDTLDHLRQEFLFLFVRAVREDGRDRALHQPRIHREGEIGRGHEFIDDHRQGAGQPLPAIFGRA